VKDMRRVLVVILDGLRRDFVDAARTPTLAALATEAESFPSFQTAFPSATRVVSATFATGCHPARHTLQGNAMALMENGRLVAHDVGRPDFLQHKRSVTGCSLAVPTMAERLAPHGGMVLFNNVSPGAAFAHDPDGFGHVYHRAASLGPGRAPVDDPLQVTLDAAGDRAMTERFIAEVLSRRRPPLAVLWLGEPDHIQHNVPLGSPEHLAVLLEADRNLGMVLATVERERARGDEILLIAGSDHGHETVSGVVDIEGELLAAGLKADASSDDVVSMPNGTAALIYLHPDHADKADPLEAFLREQDWVGRVIPARELGSVGQASLNGLAFAVSLRADEAANRFGVPGRALAAAPRWDKPDRLGCGQHGGLARFEQSPVLMIQGEGFAGGNAHSRRVHVVDLAPSIMRHLQVAAEGMDGTALQHHP
jgi:arylsulfatase A-like enzyme